MIVALEVPLAVTLQRRANAELLAQREQLQTQALLRAQTIAVSLSAADLTAKERDTLQRRVTGLGNADSRVIVVDRTGVLIADSGGPGELSTNYATPDRPEIQQALAGRSLAEPRFSRTLGQEILVAAAPIIDPTTGRVVGAVRVTRASVAVEADVRRTVIGLVAIGAAGLIAGLLIAFLLAGSFSRPLGRLAAAANRLGDGDLSSRVDLAEGATEIRDVANSFNRMANRLEATVRAQREFVANASHQLRTPLTAMKLRLESALEAARSDDVRRNVEAADHEVDRLAEIVHRLLATSRRIETEEPVDVDLADAIERAVTRWGDRAAASGASLTSAALPAVARADRTDLDQILDNLIDNAIRYAPGRVIVESGRASDGVFVAVEDRGNGIRPEDRDRVTERFFRPSGSPAGGSGLGLAIVRELAEKWGGSVEIGPSPGGGARIAVRMVPSSPANGLNVRLSDR